MKLLKAFGNILAFQEWETEERRRRQKAGDVSGRRTAERAHVAKSMAASRFGKTNNYQKQP